MGNKLYRSRSNRMIAGVCGGIGEYLDIDPTLVRLILIVLVFLGLSGVLAYIIAWIVIPEDPGNISK
ncbi:MAG TPA: PspC domain-containing protein [Clostridia bacterium]|nr:PspC domain-containing protein [Clostridia bacterium]